MFPQQAFRMRDAGCPTNFPKFLPRNFSNRQNFAAFSPTIDLLFDSDLTDICRSIIALATSVADLSWIVKYSYADSIPTIHSLQNLLRVENMCAMLIDQIIDQSNLQSSRFISLALLCMHLQPISTIQARL